MIVKAGAETKIVLQSREEPGLTTAMRARTGSYV